MKKLVIKNIREFIKTVNHAVHFISTHRVSTRGLVGLLALTIAFISVIDALDTAKIKVEARTNPVAIESNRVENQVKVLKEFEEKHLGFDEKDLLETNKKNNIQLNTTKGALKYNNKKDTPKGKHPKLDINKVVANPQTQQALFINEVAPYAYKVAKENHILPSVLIAQSVIESDSGRSTLASQYHNYFGIKGSWNDKGSVVMPTQEYYAENGGQPVTVNQPFKIYTDRAGSFQANAYLLRNGVSWNHKIYEGTWAEKGATYITSSQCLGKAYATSPVYANTLIKLIQTYGLNWLDD